MNSPKSGAVPVPAPVLGRLEIVVQTRHGRVLKRTAVSEQRVIQRRVQLREGLTIYTRVGNAPALALDASGAAGIS